MRYNEKALLRARGRETLPMALMAITPHIEDLDNFLDCCQLRRYERGQTIIYAGDVPSTLFYLIKGGVSVILEDVDHKEVVVAYLNPGDFFGEMGLFDTHKARSACCRARFTSDIAEISYDRFNDYSHQHPEILFTIGKQMANRLRNTTRKVGDLAFYDVTGRIARTLIELSKEPDAMTHPDGMQIKITRQEIGRLVNCSREMAGRVLKNLEEQNLISVHGQTVVVFGTR
jgi:CRP/FNR family cyclic AMP-dependent transcriptional regulator